MPFTETPWPDGTPCWVDIAVPDLPRALDFYGAVVGWDFVDSGEEFGHFHICQVEGRAAAGIGTLMAEDQPTFWTVYLATRDTDAAVKLVGEAGGSLLAGPMDIPDNGRMAVCADPTGGVFGLWEARGSAGAEVYNQPGTMVWEDARITDLARGREFFTEVFGYTYSPVPGMPLEEYGTFEVGGRAVGGLGGMMGAPEGTPSHWLAYFGVESTDRALAAATERGATVLRPAEDSPFGRMAILTDPFGAVFALHQATEEGYTG